MRWSGSLLPGVAVLVAAVFAGESSSMAARQPPIAPASGTGADQARALTRQEVDSWLDGYLPFALERGDIAGAVVVIVKDGAILTQRGFGYSDAELHRPVDPETTLFRPGSLSKLFIWTAVMQLVEQGRLDLDADVNGYLDFRIPRNGDRPITLRHLMTHTAGFEEQLKDIIRYDAAAAPDYRELLKRRIPRIIYPAGSQAAYSNYGAALAAYIVERSSGEPFEAYVERHILAPLGMTRSSFRQPLPVRLRPHMSNGYRRASGRPLPFELVGPAPAGALSATGADMGRFMIAHLQSGRLGNARILQPGTAAVLHRSPLTLIPSLNRMTLGFIETDLGGRTVIGHTGDTIAFKSAMYLFLDDGVGLYIALNSAGRDGAADEIRRALLRQFAGRYLPAPYPPRSSWRGDPQHIRAMAGAWVSSRRSHSTFMSIMSLLSEIQVGSDSRGGLSIPAFRGLNGQPRRWTEVAPFVWRDDLTGERLSAEVRDGRAFRFSYDPVSAINTFERVHWARSSALVLPLLAASLAVIALTVLAWPVAWFLRRRRGSPLTLTRPERVTYHIVRLAALGVLTTLAGWLHLFSRMFSDVDMLSSRMDGALRWLQVAGWITMTGLFLAAVANLWLARKRGWRSVAWSLLLALAAAAIVWIADSFNLLSFELNF